MRHGAQIGKGAGSGEQGDGKLAFYEPGRWIVDYSY